VASKDCTFSESHLPRLKAAALPPHVFALFSLLARDRGADETLRPHAERRWRSAEERRVSAENIARKSLGLEGLGRHLQGCIAATWNEKTGWLDLPAHLTWNGDDELGQAFPSPAAIAGPPRALVQLTSAQVRHVRPIRNWARRRVRSELETDPGVRSLKPGAARALIEAQIRELDQWIAAKNPRPQGRKSLFELEWWTYASWVYRHFGKHEPNTKIALQYALDRGNSWGSASYISRKQRAFLDEGRLVPVRTARHQRAASIA
jgi:hypothetical protein